MMSVSIFAQIGRFLGLVGAVVALLLATLLAGVLASPTIQAAGGSASFSIQPVSFEPNNPATQSYFDVNLNPGTTTALAMRVINAGTATGTVSLYPEDATTAENSGIVFNAHGSVLKDVGSWIVLTTHSLTLAAGQSQVVTFKLTIPSVTRPGQHMGGIIAATVDTQNTTAKNQHFQVNVDHFYGMAVQVNLPGSSTEQLAATSIKAGGANNYQQLQVGLNNRGDVMLKPYGTMQVQDSNGRVLQNLTMKLGIILPQTTINYPVAVQSKALGAGTYNATLTLHYGHNHILRYNTTFTITAQQIKQTFPNGPLQPPTRDNSFLPLWAMILLAVLGVLVIGGLSGLFFWRLAIRSITGSSNMGAGDKKSKRNKKG